MTRPAPQVLRGMRDILPSQMVLRQRVIGVLREVFERFGFDPLETPAVEYAETLEGKFGEEADKLIYRFTDRGGRQVGLRYDLTVPLARVVAMHPDLPKPFRRYQIAPVWRAERPQRGRYREFYQCDVDVVGSPSTLADAEVVAVAAAALTSLGFPRFRIKLNNRKILTALGEYAGVPAELRGSLYRAVDKLEKIGPAAVRDELAAAGVPADATARLLGLLEVSEVGDSAGSPEARPSGAAPGPLLARLRERLAGLPRGLQGVDELEQLLGHLAELGVAAAAYEVDLAMVRGLEYYTGPIFEAVVDEPKIGSLCGGGRYDDLVGLLGGQSYPATGISVGLERILDVLEELKLGPAAPGQLRPTRTDVLVTVFGPATRAESLRLVSELRQAGVNAEVTLGSEKLSGQLRYASRKGIPYVTILGPDELDRGEVVVRDMASGEQRSHPRDAATRELRATLAASG